VDLLGILSTVRSFIQQKKRLAAFVSILLIIMSAGLLFYMVKKGNNNYPSIASLPEKNDITSPQDNINTADSEEKVEVLPQNERIDEENLLQPPDPFASPPQLVGVLLDGEEEALAIIEAGGRAYITAEGETVAGLWKVEEIYRDKVKMVLEDDEVVLFLGR